MTTPTGQIGLSQVNTELTRSYNAQIDLGGTNPATAIRTLAGVASGQIGMNSLRGKTYSTGPVAKRPTAYTGLNGTTSITSAYDTTAATLDTTTYAYFYSYDTEYLQFSGFGTGTVTGTVKIRWDAISTYTDYIDGWDEWGDPVYASAGSSIYCLFNNGITGTQSASSGTTSYSGGSSSGGYAEVVYTGSINLANAVVHISKVGGRFRSGISQWVNLYNQVSVSDILLTY